jgi:esterase/lipase
MAKKDLLKLLIEKYGDLSKITKQDIIEAIRPYHVFDIEKEREKSLNRKVNGLVASAFRDRDNVRQLFLIKEEGVKVYANIDKPQDVETLVKIRAIYERTVRGFSKAIKKVNRKINFIEAQVSMEQWKRDKLSDSAQ